MCYSAKVEQDLKTLSHQMDAEISLSAFDQFEALQQLEAKAGIQSIAQKMGLSSRTRSAQFKTADSKGRIYPNYFAPLIIANDGQREIVPMRYRVRPQHSKQEIPTKYNVFNARLDSLTQRQTWRLLFGRNHALFPFIQFYEWVWHNGKKRLITFKPQHRKIMWAPAVFDQWTSADNSLQFKSFALITDEPPPEIAVMGHDRCPVFLDHKLIDRWLSPADQTDDELLSLLKQQETTKFEHSFEP